MPDEKISGTPEQRRLKYNFARLAGCSYQEAFRIRDFRVKKFILYIASNKTNHNGNKK